MARISWRGFKIVQIKCLLQQNHFEMFNMKRQIVAGDDNHYNQNKMSRSTRARNQDGTKLQRLPSWESKYICHLAVVTEKKYQILSVLRCVLAAMLPLPLTDTIKCLIKPPLQLYHLLGRVTCMQFIHIVKKLVTFGNFPEINMSLHTE